MNKLEYLKKKLRIIKILLIMIPIIGGLVYSFIIKEYFETKREIYKIQGIRLVVAPAK